MRGYYVPLVAGVVLAVSAFLPWVRVGETTVGGMTELAGIWILVLGAAATTLASLSLYTRKNSRHPLLVVGLVALGILFLSHQWMSRSLGERAWARSQAIAIVEGNKALDGGPLVTTCAGIYTGFAASIAIVLFGLTIVVKRVAKPYAIEQDDDVE
jgi:hypothetical protein